MTRIENLRSYGHWWLRSDDFWRDFPEEAETRRKHEHLLFLSCRYTMRFGTEGGADLLLSMGDPSRHFVYNFAEGGDYSVAGQPPCRVPKCTRLADAWETWIRVDFRALLLRQPRLDLRETLSRVSESFDSSSWPYSYEAKLLQWIDQNDYEAEDLVSFRIGVSQEHYSRLVRLRRLTRGWWWWDDDLGRVVWRDREDENG